MVAASWSCVHGLDEMIMSWSMVNVGCGVPTCILFLRRLPKIAYRQEALTLSVVFCLCEDAHWSLLFVLSVQVCKIS